MSTRRRCLVIHPGALGDLLLARPALTHLARLGFERVLAATPRLAALLAEADGIEATVGFEALRLHRLFVPDASATALEALTPYDAVVSWFGAGDATYRAHVARLGRPAVVARATPPPGLRRHASRHLLETLRPLGPCPAALPDARLTLGVGAQSRAAAWLAARGVAPGRAVVLHPGAGSPAKAWPGFAALARRIEVARLPVVVTAGPADGAAVARLATDGGVAENRIARDLPLPDLAALAGAARAFVGNDSGPTHLAAAVGAPTLALFGPTDPVLWAPVGPRVRVLEGNGAGTTDPWEGLTVDQVDAALRDLLASNPLAVSPVA